jgi:MFS family permease
LFLPVWQAEFGLSLFQVGALKSSYAAGMAGFQIPAGLLAERLGERGLLAAGTVVAGLAYLVLGGAAGFSVLGMLVFAMGIGSSVQHPLCSSLVSRAYEGRARRGALGIYNFSGDLGKLAFPAVAAVVLISLDWRWATTLYGAVGLAVALAVFAALGLLSSGGRTTTERAAAPSASRSGGWGIRDRRGFAVLSAIMVIDDSTRTGFLTFVPFLLAARGASVQTVGLALSLVFAGGAMGKFICGFLAERLGIVRTVILTEGLTAGGIVLLLALPVGPTLVLLPLIGAALNGTSSVLYGTVAELVEPERRARSFGLFYTVGSVASVASPVLYGLVSDLAGVPVTLAIMGAVVLTAVPLTWALRRTIS